MKEPQLSVPYFVITQGTTPLMLRDRQCATIMTNRCLLCI